LDGTHWLTLLDTLGSGSYSVAFKSAAAGKSFAIKVLYDAECLGLEGPDAAKLQANFDCELSILKDLNKHAHAVHLLATGSVVMECPIGPGSKRTLSCFVMECLSSDEGWMELGKYLEEHGPMSPQLLRVVAWQLLEFLQHLSSGRLPRGDVVIHRDLKAPNIFFNQYLRQIKVGDFGLAKRLLPHQLRESQLMEAKQSCTGSPFYMAPEVRQQAGEVTPAADIYSLGVAFVEMVGGGYDNLHLPEPLQDNYRPHRSFTEEILRSFVAGELHLGNMTAANAGDYLGVRQLVGCCCGLSIPEAQQLGAVGGAKSKAWPGPEARKTAAQLLADPSLCPWLHDSS
jgi:serine/threonine protein kinase